MCLIPSGDSDLWWDSSSGPFINTDGRGDSAMLLHLGAGFLLLSSLATAQGNPIHNKYVKEKERSYHCGVVTPHLVAAVANQHFITNLTVIIFDEIYYIDANFKLILTETLKLLRHSAVMLGRTGAGLGRARDNERPAWVLFSGQMEARPGRTLLVSHNSPFQLKEWLVTPMAKRYRDVLAVSDPALMRPKGGENDCDVGLYTHSFNEEKLGGAKATLLTTWRWTRFTRQVELFPDKFRKGFKGVHLNVALEEQPPFVFRRFSGNELFWDGVEVRLISHLSEMLNFTYEFKETNSQTGKGVVEAVQAGHSDLGIGRHAGSVKLYRKVSLSYPHSEDCAAFVSLSSTALPKYRAIMGPFLWDVWLALTATYLFAVVPLAFSAWHTLRPLLDDPAEIEQLFWYVFGTFTNLFTFAGQGSWVKGDKCSTKLFIGTYWVFTIIVTACYTGSIIAFITLPDYPEVVDTMHQLLHQNFRVLTLDREGWWELLTGADDDAASGLAGRAKVIGSYGEGVLAVLRSAKEDRPTTFFGSGDHLNYVIKTNYTNSQMGKRQMFYISKECFVTLKISMILPSDSLYTEKLNNALIWASETGVLTKIYKDIEWDFYKSSVRTLLQGGRGGLEVLERELTLDDTQGMFLLLGCGFCLAGLAWAWEVCAWARGRDVGAMGRRSLQAASRKLSKALLEPSDSHLRTHFPLYFRPDERRRSSLFGTRVSSPHPAISEMDLKPLPMPERPIRLLSF